MKVIVTKYAVTKGVHTSEARPTTADTMVGVRSGAGAYEVHFHKPDWHTTKKAARDQVKCAFEARKKSLQKALLKLDSKFSLAVTAINNTDLPEE